MADQKLDKTALHEELLKRTNKPVKQSSNWKPPVPPRPKSQWWKNEYASKSVPKLKSTEKSTGTRLNRLYSRLYLDKLDKWTMAFHFIQIGILLVFGLWPSLVFTCGAVAHRTANPGAVATAFVTFMGWTWGWKYVLGFLLNGTFLVAWMFYLESAREKCTSKNAQAAQEDKPLQFREKCFVMKFLGTNAWTKQFFSSPYTDSSETFKTLRNYSTGLPPMTKETTRNLIAELEKFKSVVDEVEAQQVLRETSDLTEQLNTLKKTN